MARIRSSAPSPERIERRRAESSARIAFAIFCLIAVAAPLAFGAVDRFTQIIVVALFAVGMAVRPAAVSPLSRGDHRLVLALVGVLLVKEFLPAGWFGMTEWRRVLVGEHGISLPWTHHPEPARALDAICTGAIAVLWFLWVRTLAADRDTRTRLAWALLVAAAMVAGVSFVTRGLDPQAIYGFRVTPGWSGFGPFPNRNHTACFFGMALALGCGSVVAAGARRAWFALVLGAMLLGVVLIALLATQSRGGLLAGIAGGACFVGLVIWKVRTRRAVGLVVFGLLLAGAVALVAGSHVLGRFHRQSGGSAVDSQRLGIWRDALAMWGDAPLFGHGASTFTHLFGIYQTVPLENSRVLHPESSWLQWLIELGAVAVLIGLIAFVRFASRHLREAFTRRRSFFLRAGAFAAVAVLLLHSLIDVPAHRWGTLGFALAALAIACPLRFQGRPPVLTRRAALVPAGLAVFWSLPLFAGWPLWSPLALQQLLTREESTGGVPVAELEKELPYFPLSVDLNQAVGVHQLRILGRARPTEWQRHFTIASALLPGAWTLPAMQARAVERVAPELAVNYWQEAVERCDLHRAEVFRLGVLETQEYPAARPAWDRYVAAHPELLLPYALLVTHEQARGCFAQWWEERALHGNPGAAEIDIFYNNAERWSTLAQFETWMQTYASRREDDFRRWASVLSRLRAEGHAFRLLAEFMPEPDFPQDPQPSTREQLEMRWRVAPTNVVNARQLALLYRREGYLAKSDEIILEVAKQPGAPRWFMQKAAYIYSRQGEVGKGVDLLLRTN